MRTTTLRGIATALGALGITAAVLTSGPGCHRGGGKPPTPQPDDAAGPIVNGRDLRVTPPGVEAATIQKLDGNAGGNALLEVTFEKQDPPLPNRLRIFLDDTGTVLRDDGAKGDAKARDGVFSAVTNFDFEELRRQPELAAKAASALPDLIFRGREVIGTVSPAAMRARAERLSKLADLSEVRQGRKIDLADLISNIAWLGVDPEKSLMITDKSVVTDPDRTTDPCHPISGHPKGNPDGVWTFKHLVTEMVAGTGVTPEEFTLGWLRLWGTNQPVSSGFSAAARSRMATRVINLWPKKPNGQLDLDQSPFRLAAIVNRIDLGQNLVYGGGNAGEGRFVFGVRDRAARGCEFLPFSVIFEYAVPRKSCLGIKTWAKKWIDLGLHDIDTPTYREDLAKLTETFVRAGAAPGAPNGSALSQLRTNENALVQNRLWELREFRIKAGSPFLFEDTVKQTPDEIRNRTADVRDFVNLNEADILLDAHTVPDFFPAGTSFRAATSLATLADQLRTHFAADGITNNDARHHFSLQTCTACHIRETGTNNPDPNPAWADNTAFLHVDPTEMPARLSRFLTGKTREIDDVATFAVTDPVVSSTTRHFNDLHNRRKKLAEFAGQSCFKHIVIPPRRELIDIPRPFPNERLPMIDDLRLDSVNDPVRFTH